ncbi:MAG: FAD-binding protein [Acidobacteriota bacterium]|nr:FAD-binding protein [Acidobacteriota bacterium]
MKSRTYLYGAFVTTLNIIVNVLSFGRYLWLEGRVRGGRFRNWIRQFDYRPTNFVQPRTEEEIVNLVKSSNKIRLFGSGHSFNAGVVTDGTLISLDKYSGLIWKDLGKKQIAVKGGTRVRDVVKILLENGLAFKALPSHDAQSIAGILSTDVHGTGRDWGFVSETVVSLKIIDGRGDIHECLPTDEIFKAAIGGIGAIGIISEVTIQAVDRFNVEQKFELFELTFVENNLEGLLEKNDHLSLYLFPFADKCQINTWNRTNKPKSFLGPLREFIAISFDALVSAWFGNFMAYTGLLPKLSNWAYGFKRGTNLVMESNKAFNRTIYHLHQELEFTVPFEQTWEMCHRFLDLYEMMYSKEMPYGLLEIRFTPAEHNRTFIGAGRNRRSTWIDLICNDSHGFEKYYAAAEAVVKETGARPHLGKYCETLDKNHLSRVHAENFERFLELMHEHDPENKFANNFTNRMFRD